MILRLLSLCAVFGVTVPQARGSVSVTWNAGTDPAAALQWLNGLDGGRRDLPPLVSGGSWFDNLTPGAGELLGQAQPVLAVSLPLGNYAGLIYLLDEAAEPALAEVVRGGFDSFRVGKNGTFTGKGRVNGVAFAVKGQLDSQGRAEVAVKLPAALTGGGAARLTLAPAQGGDGSQRLKGGLTGITGQDPLTVELVFQGVAPAAAVVRGAYTLRFPALEAELDGSAVAGPGEPQGEGVASLTLDAKGGLRCRYVLPDGTAGTRAGKLVGTEWRFYFPAAGQAGARGGLLAGQVNFEAVTFTGFHADVMGAVAWRVPANPKSALYPAGFAVQRLVLGAKYDAAAKGALAWSELQTATTAGGRNALLNTGPGGLVPPPPIQVPTMASFGGGTGAPPSTPPIINPPVGIVLGLDGSSTQGLTWTVKDGITGVDAALKLNRATGLITGTVRDEATGEKQKVYAALVQDGRARIGGFMIGKKRSASVVISPRD